MAEENVAQVASAAQPESAEPSVDRPDVVMDEVKVEVAENGSNGTEEPTVAAAQADADANEKDNGVASKENSVPPPKQESEGAENKTSTNSEAEEKNDDNANTEDGDNASAQGAADASGKSKSRRKSGVPEHRGKKLNRKGSQLKQTHLDAKPGEYYMVKLKGFPTWPAVIADQEMLPQGLLATRPQTAARLDGSYREEYADGGKRSRERTFPVMFMGTNEFAWTPNTDLRPLNVEESRNFDNKRDRKLVLAHQLAVEQQPLSHWKQVLSDHQASIAAQAEEENARQLAKEEKEKKKAAIAAKKASKEGDAADEGDDSAMNTTDANGEPKKKKANKKRELAEGEGKSETPASKKIKLINTSKSTNGTPSSSAKPKEKKDSAAKPKKTPKQKEAAAEPPKPVEPELTPEELRAKKEREILFLRHKLQKGLLSRDAPPEESQMAQMAEYINKLEGYPDLEVSIIKITKINKVLKAILKLDAIPKEAEFNFKTRSTSLLAKWNHILENAPKEAPPAPAATNGLTNGDAKAEHVEKNESGAKEEASNGTNGIKEQAEAPKKDVDVEMKDASEEVDTVMEDAVKAKTDTPAAEDAKDTAIPDAAPAVEAAS